MNNKEKNTTNMDIYLKACTLHQAKWTREVLNYCMLKRNKKSLASHWNLIEYHKFDVDMKYKHMKN